QGATQSDETPSSPGTPAQDATRPDASPSPVTPAQQQPDAALLPQVTVEPPRRRPPATSTVQTAQVSAPQPDPPPPSAPAPSGQDSNAAIQAAWPGSGTKDGDTGPVGIYSNRTAGEKKTKTPLQDITPAARGH